MSSITIKRHAGIAFVAFMLFTLTSCSNIVFPVAQPAKASWKAAMVYDETIPPETKDAIEKEFDKFIAKSNMSVIKFYKAADTTEADMIVHVKEFKPVSRGKQVGATLITLAGLTVVPVGMLAATNGGFVVAFAYIPKSHSTAKMYIRDGENNSHVRRKTYHLGGPGYLNKISTQKKRHAEAYSWYFKKVLKYYNKQILTAKRKGLATIP